MKTKLAQLFDIVLGSNRLNQISNINKSILLTGYEYKKFSSIENNSLIITDDDVKMMENITTIKSIDKNMILKKEYIFVKTTLPLKTFYVDSDKEFIVNSLYYMLIPNKKKLDKYNISSKDVWTYMNVKYFEKELMKLIQGTTISRNFKISDIKELEIDISLIDKNKTELFYKKEILNKLLNKKLKLTNKLIDKIVKG